MLVVRPESPDDHAAVYDLVLAAFGGPAEAELVTRLRPLEHVLSLVAVQNGDVVGHIMFSPVTLFNSDGEPQKVKLVGLAPVAVLPSQQKSGVGGALIRDGLVRCTDANYVGCFLIGHPDYYPRFGFKPARSTFGITSTYDVSDPVFMGLELQPDSFKLLSGTIHYHPVFQGV